MKRDFEHFKKFVAVATEGFIWGDPERVEFLKNIVNYFGEGETIYDRNKGLIIKGGIGVGKTSILRLIQKWLPQDEKFAYNPANDVVSKFNANGDEAVEVFKKEKERLFDDIGAEDMGRYYGNQVEVFEKIIYQRYDLQKQQGLRTHLTTNLSNQQLLDKYGERAYDRLKDMCNLVNWITTESNRGKNKFIIKEVDRTYKKPEPTEQELHEIRKNYVHTCFVNPFNKLKQTGVNHFAQDDAVYFFKYLLHYKLIQITKEEAESYKFKAIRIIGDTARKLVDSNKELRELKKKLEMIVDGEIDNIELVKRKAAELYFVDWCKALINSDTPIEEVLQDIGFYKLQN